MRAGAPVGDNGPRVLKFLESGMGCAGESTGVPGIPSPAYPANLVVSGTTLYYPDSSGNVQRFVLSMPSTAAVPLSSIGAGVINGVSLFSNSGVKVVGGGAGRLFISPDDGGTVMGPPSNVSGVAVGRDGGAAVLFAVTQDAGEVGTLSKFDSLGSPLGQVSSPLPIPFPNATTPGTGTPVLGQNSFVYATAYDGTVLAAKQDMTPQWAVAPAIVGNVTASSTLDCNRERPASGTGILYIANGTGWLTAYIVDSPGLDTSAPWPKYQHDARNTGNTTVSVGCP
jgi:hypothetical protein